MGTLDKAQQDLICWLGGLVEGSSDEFLGHLQSTGLIVSLADFFVVVGTFGILLFLVASQSMRSEL